MLDEVVSDFEVNVGVEQGDANLAESFGDVLFSKRALAAKAFEGTLQFVCKVFKHGRSFSLPERPHSAWHRVTRYAAFE